MGEDSSQELTEKTSDLFLYCEERDRFVKFCNMLPMLLGTFINNDNLSLGDTSNVFSKLKCQTKINKVPVDFRKIEEIKDSAEYAIDDDEEGRIEIYRRVKGYKDKFNKFQMTD